LNQRSVDPCSAWCHFQQHLRGEPFFADTSDLAVLRDALCAAGRSTADLAYALTDPIAINLRIEPYPLTNPLLRPTMASPLPNIAPTY
jgi:hypothetical protein